MLPTIPYSPFSTGPPPLPLPCLPISPSLPNSNRPPLQPYHAKSTTSSRPPIHMTLNLLQSPTVNIGRNPLPHDPSIHLNKPPLLPLPSTKTKTSHIAAPSFLPHPCNPPSLIRNPPTATHPTTPNLHQSVNPSPSLNIKPQQLSKWNRKQIQNIIKHQFVTKLYIENLPLQWTAVELHFILSKFGEVIDVYIPFKRTRKGKRFGFVRFKACYDIQRPWQKSDSPSNRKVWIRVKGIPLYAWSTSFFRSIVSRFGSLVSVAPETENKSKLDYAFLQVLTTVSKHISWEISALIDDQSFNIIIDEISQPLFHLPSPTPQLSPPQVFPMTVTHRPLPSSTKSQFSSSQTPMPHTSIATPSSGKQNSDPFNLMSIIDPNNQPKNCRACSENLKSQSCLVIASCIENSSCSPSNSNLASGPTPSAANNCPSLENSSTDSSFPSSHDSCTGSTKPSSGLSSPYPSISFNNSDPFPFTTKPKTSPIKRALSLPSILLSAFTQTPQWPLPAQTPLPSSPIKPTNYSPNPSISYRSTSPLSTCSSSPSSLDSAFSPTTHSKIHLAKLRFGLEIQAAEVEETIHIGDSLGWDCSIDTAGNLDICICCVYGSSDVGQRINMWSDLINLKPSYKSPWLVIGDFNETLSALDRKSGRICSFGSKALQDFMDALHLFAFNLTDRCFTWANTLSASKIDRAMVESDWASLFPSICLKSGFRNPSDHWPLILSQDHIDWGFKPFRALTAWWHHLDFENALKEMCSRIETQIPGSFKLLKKLSLLRKELSLWNRNVFGNTDSSVSQLQQDIESMELTAESRPLLPYETADLFYKKGEFIKKSKLMEITWRQKSRVR
ncbi:hypothetical protein Tsubulata_046951 [Turnera subulata]|uniref:RRM domain-containing protein n=1 Tax=Turnera subulata TaxID=218843 RepID=A0A9Q0FNA6_9ROSI|nr:hypothetical protein Tsubulata_046951 [Turnera subulata]